ncbi:TlpA family protein disulfide reductase [Prolixibacteraceae bacterium JC049]|nr:TlpA family protein disulfide reductase [Prolixibacteraceae bacterium JC049]
MKKLFLFFVINLLILSATIAQIPQKAFTLSNSLADLWHEGKIDQVVRSSIELDSLYAPFFVSRIHNTFSQMMKREEYDNCMKYLDTLVDEKNEKVNKVVEGVHLWGKTLKYTEKSDYEKVVDELLKLLEKGATPVSKINRYCLLIIQKLEKSNTVDKTVLQRLLIKNIEQLEKYEFIEKIAEGKESRKRAWYRYVLCESYHMAYRLNQNNEKYLERASFYSPDLTDITNKSYFFYDLALITGDVDNVGYKFQYYQHLMKNQRIEEGLEVMAAIAFKEPLDRNIKLLKECYVKKNRDVPFKQFWMKYINGHCKVVPANVDKLLNTDIKLEKKDGEWKFIDVWGTWCSPCVGGLPEIQKYYESNEKKQQSKVHVLTFSYGSRKLAEFMKMKKYTFPVVEVNNEVIKAFHITSYPTKILITPEGKYLTLPYRVDWKKYIKNYSLM